jgi:hypothetical protein
MLFRPSTYADSACLALPCRAQEKPVPRRVLKEVLVKVIKDAQLTQTSGRLVESINAACFSRAGKVLAAQNLKVEILLLLLTAMKLETS